MKLLADSLILLFRAHIPALPKRRRVGFCRMSSIGPCITNAIAVPSRMVHGRSAMGVIIAISTTNSTSNAILTLPIENGVRSAMQTQKPSIGTLMR